MQVLTAELHEIGEDHVTIVTLASLTSLGTKLFADGGFLFGREEIRDFSRVQQVVDVFKE